MSTTWQWKRCDKKSLNSLLVKLQNKLLELYCSQLMPEMNLSCVLSENLDNCFDRNKISSVMIVSSFQN